MKRNMIPLNSICFKCGNIMDKLAVNSNKTDYAPSLSFLYECPHCGNVVIK